MDALREQRQQRQGQALPTVELSCQLELMRLISHVGPAYAVQQQAAQAAVQGGGALLCGHPWGAGCKRQGLDQV